MNFNEESEKSNRDEELKYDSIEVRGQKDDFIRANSIKFPSKIKRTNTLDGNSQGNDNPRPPEINNLREEVRINDNTNQQVPPPQPQAPINHQESYLLRFDPQSKSHNIKKILSNIQQIVLVACIISFSSGKNYKVLYVPIILDLFLNFVAIGIYFKYSRIFYNFMDQNKLGTYKCLVVFAFIMKIFIMILIFVAKGEGSQKWIPWIFVVIGIFQLLADQISVPFKAYSTIFSLLNYYAVIMILFKMSGYPNISWVAVFIFHIIVGWLLFVGFVILTVIVTFMVISYLINKDFSIAILSLLGYIIAFSLFAPSSMFLCFSTYMDGGRNNFMGLSLHTSAIMSLVAAILMCLLSVTRSLGPPPLQAGNKENKVEEKKGINTILNVMQINPGYFTFDTKLKKNNNPGETKADPSSGTKKEGEEEESLCVICYSNKPNCLILPCLHAGMCKECGVSVLKKKPECVMCRKKIEKIAVIEKISDTEYKVIEELTVV